MAQYKQGEKIFTRADFSSDRKRMSTIIEYTDPQQYVCYIKGASEYIIDCCDNYIDLQTEKVKKSDESFKTQCL